MRITVGREVSEQVIETAQSESATAASSSVEVEAKPRRRQFSGKYKLRVLAEAEACEKPGDVGRLLRREGLYHSHLTDWRRARNSGALAGLAPKKRGRKRVERNPLERKVQQLERENARLQEELRKARLVVEVQGKVAGLLGMSLEDGKH